MPFDVALQRTLLSNSACLLTICANTCAIVKEGTWFALIDSHANRDVDKKRHKSSIVAVEKHLKQNSSKFELYLRDEYTSVQDYVTKSRMYYSGSWATEMDIFAAADFLETTIMTLNGGRWNAHRPATTDSQSCTENGIYLNHTGNHYEVVQCVKQRGGRNVCAGTCQPGEIDNLKTRLRKRKSNDGQENNVKAKKELQQYYNSDYREKKLKYLKDKYHKEESVKQAKCKN